MSKELTEHINQLGREQLRHTKTTLQWRWYWVSGWAKGFAKSLCWLIAMLPLVPFVAVMLILDKLAQALELLINIYPKPNDYSGFRQLPMRLIRMTNTEAKAYIFKYCPDLVKEETQ